MKTYSVENCCQMLVRSSKHDEVDHHKTTYQLSLQAQGPPLLKSKKKTGIKTSGHTFQNKTKWATIPVNSLTRRINLSLNVQFLGHGNTPSHVFILLFCRRSNYWFYFEGEIKWHPLLTTSSWLDALLPPTPKFTKKQQITSTSIIKRKSMQLFYFYVYYIYIYMNTW